MSWVPVYDDVTRNKKTRDAAGDLRISRHQLVGHLVAFWTWAVDKAPDGGPLYADDIALNAEWEGKAARFVEVLDAHGFLERLEDGRYQIHDWDDGGGRINRIRRGNRHRKQRERQQDTNTDVTRDGERDTKRDGERDVTRESRVQRREEEKRSDPPLPPQRHKSRPPGSTGGGVASPGSPEALVRAVHDRYHATMSEGTAAGIAEVLAQHRHADRECVAEHIGEADRVLTERQGRERVKVPWRFWLRAFENTMTSCLPPEAAEPEPSAPIDWDALDKAARDANMAQFKHRRPAQQPAEAVTDGA